MVGNPKPPKVLTIVVFDGKTPSTWSPFEWRGGTKSLAVLANEALGGSTLTSKSDSSKTYSCQIEAVHNSSIETSELNSVVGFIFDCKRDQEYLKEVVLTEFRQFCARMAVCPGAIYRLFGLRIYMIAENEDEEIQQFTEVVREIAFAKLHVGPVTERLIAMTSEEIVDEEDVLKRKMFELARHYRDREGYFSQGVT
ncbi:hypothetical protein [Cognatiyoonia sp. IB215182]|uniref:hypothetical protein n=1 Tax=Cognatiyoonia sp. IB215182 TaxID=3097353 RepID=UPI002A0F76F0|nr:hypothetical protein [Cognatiyoonia sp. IB215182]MDX8353996.1 hypothetical protein [Cognatiyoonia sp. IB215182]